MTSRASRLQTRMAIDDLLDEHEQGEVVRNWLRRNGASILTGILIGLAMIMGWKWWQAKQASDASARAQQFEALVANTADPAKAAAGLAKLPADSMYGALARMQLARSQVDAGKSADALATLKQIQVKDAGIMSTVQVRIARLLIETGKPQEAITTVKALDSAGAFEVTGDAYARLGKNAEAQAAYKRALTAMEVGSNARAIVELKLEDVGGQVPNAGVATS